MLEERQRNGNNCITIEHSVQTVTNSNSNSIQQEVNTVNIQQETLSTDIQIDNNVNTQDEEMEESEDGIYL